MANLIGTGLNQVPTNGLLGNMAFQNKEAVSMDLLGVSGNLIVNGRLGVGTNAPDYPFVVLSSTATPTAWFKHTGGTDSSIILGDPSTISNECGIYGRTTGAFNFVNTTGGRFVWKNTGGTEYMRVDSSGNLGLGVVPSAWEASYRAFQFGAGSSFLTGRIGTFQNRQLLLGIGASHNGTNWIYTPTGIAIAHYEQIDGRHQWFNAPSGTAGNTVSWTQAMTLDATGNLSIGTAFNYGRLTAAESVASGDANISIYNSAGAAVSGVQGTKISFLNDSGFSEANPAAYIQTRSNDGGGSGQTTMRFGVYNGSGLIEAARITSAGDLVVGRTSTLNTGTLSVLGTGKQAITSQVTVDGNSLFQGYSSTTTLAFQVIGSGQGYFAGNLGVGTTSPTSASGYTSIHVNNATNGGFIEMSNATTVRAQSGVDSTGFWLKALTSHPIHFSIAGTERMRITTAGNVQVGTPSLATTATDGFPYIPTCAGAPTGTPTAITGYAPMVVDSTNNKLYVYVGGAWQAMN